MDLGGQGRLPGGALSKLSSPGEGGGRPVLPSRRSSCCLVYIMSAARPILVITLWDEVLSSRFCRLGN